MSEMPTEDYEHTEHAMHAHHEAEGGNKFIGTVAMTIAVLAVVGLVFGGCGQGHGQACGWAQ